MRDRSKFLAGLGTVVAVLAALIVGWLIRTAPAVQAERPAPVPASPGSDAGNGAGAPVTDSGGAGGTTANRPGDHRHKPKPDKPKPDKPKPDKRAPTGPAAEESTWDPPSLGGGTAPTGADYAGDRQTFTVRYSSLEAGTEAGLGSGTSQTATVRTPGYTHESVLKLAVQGYVLTDDATTARLTVTAGGAGRTYAFGTGTDAEFLRTVSVPLRGAQRCEITVRVEVAGDSGGYLNVASLDGELH